MTRVANRQQPLTFELALKIAAALDLSPVRVLMWARMIDDPSAIATVAEGELLRIFSELAYDDQDRLLYIAKGLRERSSAATGELQRRGRRNEPR